MIEALRAAKRVQTVDDFKTWIRERIRPLLPHEALACGCGHLHAAGFSMDYVVTVDFPLEHLAAIRNRAGGIDTPILRHWLRIREPVLFDIETPWPGVPELWLANCHRYQLHNGIAHGVHDQERCVGSYFSFHRLPRPLGTVHRAMLSELTPVLHETLLRVIGNLEPFESLAGRLAVLAPREREIGRWINQGKTNLDIARLLGLSENTIKHHVASILKKIRVSNRVQLASLIGEHERQLQQRSGTKML